MGLEVPNRRPLAKLAARSAIEGTHVRDWHTGPYAPPATVEEYGLGQLPVHAGDVCVQILRGLLLGEDLTRVRAHLASDIVAWSPHLFATCRDQLLMSMDVEELNGDTLTEVTLEASHVGVIPPRVYVEWRLTARFTSPGFIDDDLMIEPTGRLLETAGFEVVTFRGEHATSVHLYYDDLALLEQLLTSR